MKYEPRIYRDVVDVVDLVSFAVSLKETDLHISATTDLSGHAEDLIARARWDIESFIVRSPRFAETFAPFDVPDNAPDIVQRMAAAASVARVGPMAAVAGAIAEYVAKGLAEFSPEVIVENGGDDYIIGTRERIMGVWAGSASPVTGRVGLRISPELMPIAVCTSSGRIGHSASFGNADTVTVLAQDGALADAVATALANRVREPEDVGRAVEAARNVPGVLGVLVVEDGRIGAWGNVRLVPLKDRD